jgi:hypothetical protein
VLIIGLGTRANRSKRAARRQALTEGPLRTFSIRTRHREDVAHGIGRSTRSAE